MGREGLHVVVAKLLEGSSDLVNVWETFLCSRERGLGAGVLALKCWEMGKENPGKAEEGLPRPQA